jgi:CRISPR system Cascade subunit CasA
MPFYQVAGMGDDDDVFGPFSVAKLNGELLESDNPDTPRLFSMRSGDARETLSYAEAARWLLYTNGFAETFGQMEAKGKTESNNATVGVGWLGKLGLIFAEGSNLFETLMLNFVLLNWKDEPWSKEKPLWEIPQKTVSCNMRCPICLPDNQSQLLTLQSRLISLVPAENAEDKTVTSFYICAGEFFDRNESFAEQMTTWRYGRRPTDRDPHYYPRFHDPSRQMWRDFASLFTQRLGTHADNSTYRRPGVVSWIAKLQDKKRLKKLQFTFRIAAVTYGNMQAVVSDTFSDSLTLNAKILAKIEEEKGGWIFRIIDELETTEKWVDAVAVLAANLLRASAEIKENTPSGKKKLEETRDTVREQAYFRLDMPFRRWLESINPKGKDGQEGDDMDSKSSEWHKEAQLIIRKLGDELVENVGIQAFMGRGKFNSSKAQLEFLSATAL